MAFPLWPCPSELAELPPDSISPEVRQVVEEAFRKRHAILNQTIQEDVLELASVDSVTPSIYFPSAATQIPNEWTNAHSTRNSTEPHTISRSSMPWALPVDELDQEPQSTSWSLATHGSTAPITVQEPRVRPLSDSQSSGTSSNFVSTIGSESSGPSVDTQLTQATGQANSLKESQNRRTRPKDWIKNRLSRASPPNEKEVDECLACATEFPIKQLVVLACLDKHKYCRLCFEQLIKAGCENEGVFPPQCCQVVVSPKLIMAKVSRSTRGMYAALDKAVKIAPDERWYCPYPKCAKAIDVSKIDISQRGAKCPHCRHHMCVSCKQPAHTSNTECRDGALMATLLMSKDRGWQKCYRCGEMVELAVGCRHIKCRCKAEFCYICTKKWGSCVDNYFCAKKLEESRTASISEEANTIEPQEPVANEPARRRTADFSRSTARSSTDLTEEERVAQAVQETLQEMEDEEMRQAIEESKRTAAVISVVEKFKAKDGLDMEAREEMRLARIARRFRSYDGQLQQVKIFQQDLLRKIHIASSVPLPSSQEHDMVWLQRMHTERLAILAEDRQLLMQDSSFDLKDYRLTARHVGTPSDKQLGRNAMSELSPNSVSITRQNATKVRPSIQSRSTARVRQAAVSQRLGSISLPPRSPPIKERLERITLVDP